MQKQRHLNSQQQIAVKMLFDTFAAKAREARVAGMAGTGKTHVVRAALDALRATGKPLRVAAVAPSHEATKVLARAIGDCPFDSMTLSALIGERYDPKLGQYYPVPGLGRVGRYDLIVCDEASQVRAVQRAYLLEECERFFQRPLVWWLGDDAQLPPVGEDSSSVFKAKMPEVKLLESIRCSAILNESLAILRQAAVQGQPIPKLKTLTNNDLTEGLIVLPRQKWQKNVIAAFSSSTYQENHNAYALAAYRNVVVDSNNAKIRAALKPGQPEYVEGDRLVAVGDCLALSPDGYPTLANRARATVCQTFLATVNLASEGIKDASLKAALAEARCWILDVQPDSGGPLVRLQVPCFETKLDFAAACKQLRGHARRLFERQVDFVSYTFAGTAHCLQGQTIDNSIFCEFGDMARDKKLASRLAYTAASRARKRAIVVY